MGVVVFGRLVVAGVVALVVVVANVVATVGVVSWSSFAKKFKN